jgi:hypothetical protein
VLALLCGALLAGCGPALPTEPASSFEDFQATVPQQPDGAYIVEGDVLLYGEDSLRAYYEAFLAPASGPAEQGSGLAQQESSLAVSQRFTCRDEYICEPICADFYVCDPAVGPSSCQFRTFCSPFSQTIYVCDFAVSPPSCGWRTSTLYDSCAWHRVCYAQDDVWGSGDALNLTYCLKDFGTRYAEVARAVRSAARSWEKVANVRFIHRRDLDGTACGSGVLFTVQPQPGASFLAAATLPSQTLRTVSINLPGIDGQAPSSPDTRSLEQLLTHELGHLLGFRHDKNDPNEGSCFSSSLRNLTGPDPLSVMRYPSCPVSQPDAMRELSAKDAQGARSVYGAPASIKQVGLRTSDGCFLKAEGEGGGRLSSRGNGIFPWETFELIELGNSKVALRARNGDFVAAEADGTLNANRSQLGANEQFTLGSTSVNGPVTLRTAHGKFVSAQCTTTLVGSNDGGFASNQFQIIPLESHPIALKANNGKFLGTQVSPTTTGTRIFRDESLYLVQLGGGKVSLRSRDGRYARAVNGGGGAVLFDSPGLGQHETYTLHVLSGEMQVAFRALSGHWLAVNSAGQLVASSPAAQAFTQIDLRGQRVALQAPNGQFVQAVNGGGGDVRAVGGGLGEWETFFLVQLGGGKVALRNGRGMYMTAELNSNASTQGLLFSRVDWIDTWERFTQTGAGGGTCLRAESTGQFVAAEGGGGRELVANRAQCAQWETFTLVGF